MTIEVTAKKVDDAIKQGLEQLGASLDEVKVEVLESGGFLRKAKVRLTLERETVEQEQAKTAEPKTKKSEEPAEKKPEKPQPEKKQDLSEPKPKQKIEQPKKSDSKSEEKPSESKPEQPKKPQPKKKPEQPKAAEPKTEEAPEKADGATPKAEPRATGEEVKKAIAHATEFIDELIKKMGFDEATVEVKENGDVDITAPAGDDSLIIGRHGETLSAISFLAETIVRAEKQHVNIVADCNGYRARRAASLTSMAKRRASECAAKHRKIKLEPMERVDRRTIHNALSDDDRVTTVSEGKEPHRYIVILPKNKGQ